MNPVVAGSLIGAGGNLLGGLLGSSDAHKNRRMQKEFAQYGIRWRVEDAKAAGLHPLYALGAQIPSFSPVHSEAPAQLAEMGQNIGRAVQATQTAAERQRSQLELELLKSQVDESKERIAASMAARNAQAATQTSGLGVDSGLDPFPPVPEGVHIIGQHVNKPGTSYIASERDESASASVSPMWGRFMIGNGREIVLPGGLGGDAAEALESLSESPLLLAMTYLENKHRYGGAFTEWFKSRYGSTVLDDAKNLGLDMVKGLGRGSLGPMFEWLKRQPVKPRY